MACWMCSVVACVSVDFAPLDDQTRARDGGLRQRRPAEAGSGAQHSHGFAGR